MWGSVLLSWGWSLRGLGFGSWPEKAYGLVWTQVASKSNYKTRITAKRCSEGPIYCSECSAEGELISSWSEGGGVREDFVEKLFLIRNSALLLFCGQRWWVGHWPGGLRTVSALSGCGTQVNTLYPMSLCLLIFKRQHDVMVWEQTLVSDFLGSHSATLSHVCLWASHLR